MYYAEDLENLEKFCNIISYFLTEEASKKHPFPCPCTYRTALLHYLDITSVPRTHILRELAEYATEDKDKEFLIQITSPTPEGKVCLLLICLVTFINKNKGVPEPDSHRGSGGLGPTVSWFGSHSILGTADERQNPSLSFHCLSLP